MFYSEILSTTNFMVFATRGFWDCQQFYLISYTETTRLILTFLFLCKCISVRFQYLENNCVSFPSAVLCKVRQAAENFNSNQSGPTQLNVIYIYIQILMPFGEIGVPKLLVKWGTLSTSQSRYLIKNNYKTGIIVRTVVPLTAVIEKVK
jgi:hypothetical protein